MRKKIVIRGIEVDLDQLKNRRILGAISERGRELFMFQHSDKGNHADFESDPHNDWECYDGHSDHTDRYNTEHTDMDLEPSHTDQHSDYTS